MTMNFRNLQNRSGSGEAFSLIEVTLSIGIIAAVLLPTLAMLSGGGSTHTRAKDGAVAARIAESLTGALARLPDGGGFELILDRETIVPIPLPESGEAPPRYFALDEYGKTRGEVDASTFERGGAPQDEAIYLAEVRFRGSGQDSPFLDLLITVEYPARAARSNRDREFFPTRVAMP
jgi:hypothetical protein